MFPIYSQRFPIFIDLGFNQLDLLLRKNLIHRNIRHAISVFIQILGQKKTHQLIQLLLLGSRNTAMPCVYDHNILFLARTSLHNADGENNHQRRNANRYPFIMIPKIIKPFGEASFYDNFAAWLFFLVHRIHRISNAPLLKDGDCRKNLRQPQNTVLIRLMPYKRPILSDLPFPKELLRRRYPPFSRQ